MKSFIIFARDREGAGALRAERRQAHLDYWLGLGDALKVAGAMMSGDADDAVPIGSSFLLQAENEQAARDLVAGDPFTRDGVFGPDIVVQPVRPAIGAWFRPA